MTEDERLLVVFQRLTDTAATLRHTTDASRDVTLARFQQMEHHFAVAQTLLPPVHEQASRYLQAIRARYLALLATYEHIADQLDATAQHAETFHAAAVRSFSDVREQA